MTTRRALWWLATIWGAALSFGVGAAPAPLSRAEAETDSCAIIPLASAAAPGVSLPSPSDPPAQVSRTTYRIRATLDPVRHTISGRQWLTWHNPSPLPVCTVYLHLDMNAFENAGTYWMSSRAAADATTQPVRPGQWGYSELTHVRQRGRPAVWMHLQTDLHSSLDRSVVRVDLPHPVAPGASTTLDIGFVDRLPGSWASVGHYRSFHLVAHWFPRMAILQAGESASPHAAIWKAQAFAGAGRNLREPADFDVRIVLPARYAVAASGEPVAPAQVHGGWRVHRFVQNDVTDFAWSADSRFAPPLEYLHTPPGGRPVTLRVFHHPEHATAAASVLGAMSDALGVYTHALADYPHRTLTAVITPFNAHELGGLSLPTLFTTHGVTAAEPGTAGAGRLDRETWRGVGRAYFDGIIGDDGTPDAALALGLTDYWGERSLGQNGQAVPLPQRWMELAGLMPSTDRFAALRAGTHLRGPADDDRLRAARVALALHDLEARVTATAMERGLREYLRRWRGRHPRMTDLRTVLGEGSGQPAEVDRAFAQYIEGARTVDDRVASFTSEEVLPRPGFVQYRGTRLELTQADLDRAIARKRQQWQRLHGAASRGGPFPYRTSVVVQRNGARVPQTLQVQFADGSVQRVRWDGTHRVRRFSWLGPSPAISAQLDPHRHVMLDVNKLDDGLTRGTNVAPARRWGGDFAAAVQVITALLVNL